ncbi:uncharacterized protein [Antedon mediterranea]|uniref:uncharacterized protein n=1 Tax=Antedon mediterranea TaxID=105859 RepID=UPI003AF75388
MAVKKQKTPASAKKQKAPPKPVEPESSEEESSEEEVAAPPPKKTPKSAKAKQKPVKKAESSEEESSDEEPAPAKAQTKKQTPKAKAKKEESSEEESDEGEEEAKPAPVKKAAKKGKAKKESSSEEESEEEEPKKAAKKTPAKVQKKQAAKEESEEESDEEESSEEEEEPPKKEAKKKAAKVQKKAAKEEESDDESEEDESEEDEPPVKKTKGANGAAKTKAASTGEPIPVFIGGLDPELDPEVLVNFFKENGVEVLNPRLVARRRFGYVDVSSEEEFKKILELHGSDLEGSSIRIDRANPPKTDGERSTPARQQRERGKGSDDRTMFVKGLNYDTVESTIQEYFGAQDVRIPKNDYGRSKGFAYVEFSSEEDVKKAIEAHQGTELEGRSVFLDYVGDKRGSGGGGGGGGGGGFGKQEQKTVMLRGLSAETTEDSIRSAIGGISIRIPTDRDTGEPKGIAFVDFSSEGEAKKCVDEHGNGIQIDETDISLDLAKPRRDSFGGGGRGGGFRGGRGGGFRGGRGGGGFRGGRGGGGFRGGRGGGGRGGFRGGRGGGFGGQKRSSFGGEGQNKKIKFDD